MHWKNRLNNSGKQAASEMGYRHVLATKLGSGLPRDTSILLFARMDGSETKTGAVVEYKQS